MKFALIEDRISRLELYVDFDLKNYNNVTVITGSVFDCFMTALKSKHFDVLDKFDCIASHRSALSNELRDLIKEFCKAKRKPLIFFSGGITSSVFKDSDFPFLHINSKDFYSSHLKMFLDDCEKSNRINLLLLQFGHRWKLSLLLNLRNHIAVALNKLEIKNMIQDVKIDDTEIIKRVRDLQINSLIKPDLINESTKDILTGNDFTTLTLDQIKEVQNVINRFIYELV